MIDYRQWQSCEHDDEPRDQQIDFDGPYWAQCGPDERRIPGGWSWTIMDCDDEMYPEVITGHAATEQEAKSACERQARYLLGKATLADRFYRWRNNRRRALDKRLQA